MIATRRTSWVIGSALLAFALGAEGAPARLRADDAPPAAIADWPQHGRDASRSGATAADVSPPHRRAWCRWFHDEGLSPSAQPVVVGSRVWIGSLAGLLYALDLRSGRNECVTPVGAPVLHSAAVGGGAVVVGLADGTIRGFDEMLGTPRWTVATGAAVWSAPLVVAGRAIVACRDGAVRSIDLASGEVAWTYDAGARCVQSPALDASRGDVLVLVEDGRVHAIEVASGQGSAVGEVDANAARLSVAATLRVAGERIVVPYGGEREAVFSRGDDGRLERVESTGLGLSTPGALRTLASRDETRLVAMTDDPQRPPPVFWISTRRRGGADALSRLLRGAGDDITSGGERLPVGVGVGAVGRGGWAGVGAAPPAVAGGRILWAVENRVIALAPASRAPRGTHVPSDEPDDDDRERFAESWPVHRDAFDAAAGPECAERFPTVPGSGAQPEDIDRRGEPRAEMIESALDEALRGDSAEFAGLGGASTLARELARAVDSLASPPARERPGRRSVLCGVCTTLRGFARADRFLDPEHRRRARQWARTAIDHAGPTAGDAERHAFERARAVWEWAWLTEEFGEARSAWRRLRDDLPATSGRDATNVGCAGLVAALRLATELDDDDAAARFGERARRALADRVRFEWRYPRGRTLEPATGGGTWVRWLDLGEELGRLLLEESESAAELAAFTLDRLHPAWHVRDSVFGPDGDSGIEGPDARHAAFLASAYLRRSSPAELAGRLDLAAGALTEPTALLEIAITLDLASNPRWTSTR